MVYLDSGSDITMINESYVKKMKLRTREHPPVDIDTLGSVISINRAVSLSLGAPGRRPVRELIAAVAEFNLTPVRKWRNPEQKFPSLQKFQERINTVDVEDGETVNVDILIGVDQLYTVLGSQSHRPEEKWGRRFALLETPFGLVPVGAVPGEKTKREILYQAAAANPKASENREEAICYATFKIGNALWPWAGRPVRGETFQEETDVPARAYQDMDKMLKLFFSLESISVLDAAFNPRTRSQEAYLSSVKSTLKRREDGSYETSLVYNPDIQDPPCNYAAVKGHASKIYGELVNKGKKEDYDAAIQKLVDQGIATLEPDQGEEEAIRRKEMFVGLMPVLKPNLVTGELKVRLVLACAMKYKGISTNDRLMDPPPLEADLFPILMGVRKYKHVLCRDIASFFPTLRLPPSQHGFSCCLIKDGKDTYRKLRFTSFYFGWSCSPALCQIVARIHIMHSIYPKPTLQETLDSINPEEDALMLFGSRPKALDTDNEVQRIAKGYIANLFVDDAIQSFMKEYDLIRSFQVMESILNDAHYRTTKIYTNSEEARNHIPREQLLLDAEGEIPNITNLLGIPWNAKEDTLSPVFKINQDLGLDKEGARVTKKIAAIIMGSTYDPLQIGAPFSLQGKLILQQAHKEFQALLEEDEALSRKSTKAQWNTPLSEELTIKTKKYLSEAPLINDFKTPRWLGFEEGAKVEFYLACDASVHTLGAIVHVKVTKKDEEPRLIFVAAKSKTYDGSTIPRGEVTACEMGATLLTKIIAYLEVEDPVIYAATDATVALAWINTEETKLLKYVYNRVKKIKAMIPPSKWYHIEGVRNPADYATKPLTIKQLMQKAEGENWLRPKAYLEEGCLKPGHKVTPDNSEAFYKEMARKMPEKMAAALTRSKAALWAPCDLWATTMGRHSDLHVVLKKMALLMRWYRPYLKAKQLDKPFVRTPLPIGPTRDEIHESLLEYVRRAQRAAFPREMKYLKRREKVPSDSNIAQLMPFLDQNGLLRAAGRARDVNDQSYTAMPMILQKNDPLARRIIDDLHRRHDHKSDYQLEHMLRKNFWVIRAKQLINSVVKKCVPCQKKRGRLYQQQLGLMRPESIPETINSPKPRLKLWSAIAIDTLGSYTYLDASNKPRKCYILIIVEMISRYIRLVMLNNLSSRCMYVTLETHAALFRKPDIVLCDNFSSFTTLDKFHIRLSQHMRKELRQLLEADGISMGVLRERGRGEDKTVSYSIGTHTVYSAPHAHQIAVEAMVSLLKRGFGVTFSREPMRREDFTLRLELAAKHVNSRPLVAQDGANKYGGMVLLTPALLHHHQDDMAITPYVSELRLKGAQYRELAEVYNDIRRDRDAFAKSFVDDYLRHMIKTKVWRKGEDALKEGDLVLIKPENQLLKRHEWKMAVVEKLYPSKRDGLAREADLRFPEGKILKRTVRQLVLLKTAKELQGEPSETAETAPAGPETQAGTIQGEL